MKKSEIPQKSRLLVSTRQQNLLEFETSGARLLARLVKCGKTGESKVLESALTAMNRLKFGGKCDFPQLPWVDIEMAFRQTFANMLSSDFSLANSEAISLGVLVEEVLVECEDTIGVRRKNTGILACNIFYIFYSLFALVSFPIFTWLYHSKIAVLKNFSI